ncbi:MAG: RNA polymerase factor sigma-54 [Gammaproteobacteria bacterium]|nr:RNA polymerase factor sigma-54 [Gammaproteobacteria bacterium]
MKQTLSLKIGQHLAMTPQLQQAIRLLQLSTLDLCQEIQETLESNPMLELDEEEALREQEALALANEGPAPPEPVTAATIGNESEDAATSVDNDFERPIPEDLPVDTSWDDIYQPASSTPTTQNTDGGNWDIDATNGTSDTLQDHLLWQLNLTPMSELDQVIATTIIDAIDTDGMLTQTVAEITESVASFTRRNGVGTDAEIEIEPDEVIAVLKRIQHFDPTGIAARDLGECLSLQLRALPSQTPWRSEAVELVENYLDLLGGRDFATLKRKTKLAEEDLARVVELIQSLNPRPGTTIANEQAEYITPDVTVKKNNGRWVVELNGEATPKLRINDSYANLIRRADNSSDNTFLKNNLQEARWFLKSLQSRNETLLKVATKIVEHQRGFLEYGEEAMKPLVLHDIAEAVEMHESTISRVTSRKYMHTPRGIFELKYFFSSHVATNTGGEVSSTAIRALIKKLTADENPKKPLSDNSIAAILADQNIKVARRTVAKYRESMAIPPSNERKRLV